jgi:hypothetical protein
MEDDQKGAERAICPKDDCAPHDHQAIESWPIEKLRS